MKTPGPIVLACAAVLTLSVALAQTPAPPTQEEGPAAPQLATELNETVEKVTVTVQPMFGDPRNGEMIITHFRPPGDGPFPAVIVHHGRSATNRAEPGRWRYLPMARYWLRRGVAVFVPTRLGYGDTGLEPDPEETGPCGSKRFGVAAEATNVQSLAALEVALNKPWVDKNKLIVMGQSMGGFATIAVMAKRHPAVMAGINFAGGGGGDPVARRGDPCSYNALANLFGEAGKANAGSTPMLWLYAQNDHYWGPEIPRRWHNAYVRAGGKAEFVMFPPVGTDGHALMGVGMQFWRPVLDRFIAPLGIKAPGSDNTPPATSFAALDDTVKLPLVKPEVKDNGYRRFLNSDVPRAFAIGPKGEWAFQSGADAMKHALDRCEQTAKAPCKLYAVDDAVVWVQ